MKEKVCGVTGHRAIPAEYMEQVKQGLRREIEKAIADGYTYFISGFADGVDQLFAGIVLEKAKENPALRLEAAIPYRNRYVVEHSDRVIAVYDGRDKGGTVSTIRMVHAQRKEMREVPVGSYLPESMINLGYFRNASGR